MNIQEKKIHAKNIGKKIWKTQKRNPENIGTCSGRRQLRTSTGTPQESVKLLKEHTLSSSLYLTILQQYYNRNQELNNNSEHSKQNNNSKRSKQNKNSKRSKQNNNSKRSKQNNNSRRSKQNNKSKRSKQVFWTTPRICVYLHQKQNKQTNKKEKTKTQQRVKTKLEAMTHQVKQLLAKGEVSEMEQ